MKRLVGFIKTTMVGGFFVLFPLLLFWMLLAEVLNVLVTLATPIADVLPERLLGDAIDMPILLAIVLLMAMSFAFGLLLKSRLLAKVGRRFDAVVMAKLPAYRAIKSLTHGLLRARDTDHFYAAILTVDETTKEIVYVTEDLGGEWVTVLQPLAPVAFAGSLRMVPRSAVEPLDISLLDASAHFANFGVGALAHLDRQDG